MSNNSLKYQLLAELLRSLEAEGFVMGTGKHLQMQELLAKLPEMEVEQLKGIFAPVICTNEKEQELFYTIFDESLKRAKAVHQPMSAIARRGDASNKWKKWIWLLAIPVALTTAFLLKEFFMEEVVERPPLELPIISFTIQPDSSKTICLEDRIDKEILDKFTSFSQSGMGQDETAQKGSSEKGAYEIEEITCLKYQAKDVLGKDSIRLFLTDSLNVKTAVVFYPHIEEPVKEEEAPVNEEEEPIAQKTRFETKPYPYPNDIRSLEYEPPTKLAKFYTDNHTWVKPLFLLLLAGLLWVIIKFRAAKRQKLVAELESKVKPPYVWNINIEGAEQIEMNDAFYSVLNKLRQRTTDEAVRLDIPKTVDATIEKGGMANFQYRQLTRPPEYLLLIDQQSGANHRAQVFDYLYRAFQANEIIIERFFFDGDPRLCYNEAHPKGLSIKELHHQYYNSRLLLMSNGYSLLSPLSGKLSKWVSLFSQWKQRSILTPIANEAWGKRESRLEEAFDILPATLQGLDFLVEQLDAGEDGDFSNWKEKIKDAPKETIQLKGGLLNSLQHYYSEDMIEWIAACAVYPTMHWDLTLHIGELLSDSEKNLLTIDNLIEIIRLPWFAEGEIPPAARARLLSYLEEKHPATLQKVRVGLHTLFQNQQPPADSVAHEDYQMNVALNEWLFTDDKKRKKELEKDIAQQLEAGVEADFTVIKYLDRERTPLDFIVPDKWKKYVHKGGHAGLGMKDVWKDVLYWALPIWLLLGSLMLWYHPEDVCEGELVEYQRLDEKFLLCIDSPADRILLYEYQAREAIGLKFYDRVDSLVRATNSIAGIENVKDLVPGLGELDLIRSVDFTSSDSLAYRAFFKNTATEYFNRAVPVMTGIEESRGKKEYDEAFFKNIACNLLTRAAILDNKDRDILEGEAVVCNGITTNSVTALFSFPNEKCCAPCKLEFENGSTNADQYEWDFDDGSVTVPVRVFETQSHVFFKPGVYNVKLTARNGEESDVHIAKVEVCDEDTISTIPDPISTQDRYPLIVEEIYAKALSDIEALGEGMCKSIAENSIKELEKFKSEVFFHSNEESNNTRLGTFRDAANYLVSVVEGCHSGKDNIANESSIEEKEKEVERIFAETLATLRKSQNKACRALISKNIEALNILKKEVVFYGQQTAIANLEIENQKIVDDFANESKKLEDEIRKCQKAAASEVENVIAQIERNMVRIPAGTFEMGCTPDQGDDCKRAEKPVRKVRIKNFKMGKFEVTQKEWRTIMGEDPPRLNSWHFKGNDQHPVQSVSVNQIREFLKKLNKLTNKSYRLPTEAEWEYAARGGQKYKYAGSNNLDEVAWYAGNSKNTTHNVGQKKPNGYGLYDMNGNVGEFCEDTWHDNYKGAPTDGRAWKGVHPDYIRRGLCWSDKKEGYRISIRSGFPPIENSWTIGFRLAL